MRTMKTGAHCAALMLTLALAACGGGSETDEQSTAAATQETAAAAEETVSMPTGVDADVVPAAAPTPIEVADDWQATTIVAEAQASTDDATALSMAEVHPLHILAQEEVTPLVTYTGDAGPYAPQDFRGAYAFPAMPANFSTATAAQKSSMGAGQTVYVIVAYHDPATLSYLNIAAQRFGLPTCSEVAIDYRAKLPLASAPTTGCTFSVVGADLDGNIAPLPGSHSGWGVEEAMDTQLVHAAAPLARIVVIAAQSSAANAMGGAIKLANKMGNGVVSMSFGASDHTAFGMMDPLFKQAGMNYVASSGDLGYNSGKTNWPAAVPTVLAVGGTSLRWNGVSRTEQAWSLGGGGASSWRPAPTYQKGYSLTTTKGKTVTTTRMVPDVSLNADGVTGYLVYAKLPTGPQWFKVGGTSASAPIWGALIATANAMRKDAKKAAVASVHDVLYRSVGMTSPVYQANLFDVTNGANGACVTCSASAGYDLATGLGTPRNVTTLLATLAK